MSFVAVTRAAEAEMAAPLSVTVSPPRLRAVEAAGAVLALMRSLADVAAGAASPDYTIEALAGGLPSKKRAQAQAAVDRLSSIPALARAVAALSQPAVVRRQQALRGRTVPKAR
jgi:hypothetical protein